MSGADGQRPLERRVAVVTGGGGGIGSEIAFELARQGAAVVAVDAGVGVQGEPLGEQTAAVTARRIREAGGTATSATTSVTDADAISDLFNATAAEFGSLDIVVNTAGFLRFRRLADATEDDWRAVLGVHFDGYLNVLSAALPIMAATGYGRVLGLTSGVGLARTSVDGPAYGSAKRSVAALTWQLGRTAPPGVTVNALSPIAATRMVSSALIAAGANPQGLDLSAMPQPAAMAPLAAYMCGEHSGWCSGRILFCAGTEASLIMPPATLEAVRSSDVPDFAGALGTLVPTVLVPAEARQRTTGGSNPRFGPILSSATATVEQGA